MPTAEMLDWGPSSGLEGLQDSLGSCTVPENSLFTAHRKSGSWSSTLGSCSEESHCLWTARRNKNQNQSEQLEEISVTARRQFDYFITSDECNCQTEGGKKKTGVKMCGNETLHQNLDNPWSRSHLQDWFPRLWQLTELSFLHPFPPQSHVLLNLGAVNYRTYYDLRSFIHICLAFAELLRRMRE